MLQTVECRQYHSLSQNFTKFPFPLSCCKTQHRWKQTADWPTYLFFFHISSQPFVCGLVTTNNRCVGSFVLDKTQHHVSRLPRFVLRCVVSKKPSGMKCSALYTAENDLMELRCGSEPECRRGGERKGLDWSQEWAAHSCSLQLVMSGQWKTPWVVSQRTQWTKTHQHVSL